MPNLNQRANRIHTATSGPTYFPNVMLRIFLVLTMPVYAEEASSRIDTEVRKVFEGCDASSEIDLYNRVKKLESFADSYARSLTTENAYAELYEEKPSAQLLTLIAPHIFDKKYPLAGFAKTCWVQYVDWIKSFENSGKFDSSEFFVWTRCVNQIYPKTGAEIINQIKRCYAHSN